MMVNKSTVGDVCSIRLKHRELDLKFAHHVFPGPYKYIECGESYGELKLEFADLYEVDMLIQLLTQFRKSCAEYMGEYVKAWLPNPIPYEEDGESDETD